MKRAHYRNLHRRARLQGETIPLEREGFLTGGCPAEVFMWTTRRQYLYETFDLSHKVALCRDMPFTRMPNPSASVDGDFRTYRDVVRAYAKRLASRRVPFPLGVVS